MLIDAAAALQAALEIKSSGGGSLLLPSVITRLLASKSCRSAIMFGDALDNVSCETLISSLTSSLDPFHCAHGRPAIAPLSTPPVIPQHTKPSFCNLMARKKPFLAKTDGLIIKKNKGIKVSFTCCEIPCLLSPSNLLHSWF